MKPRKDVWTVYWFGGYSCSFGGDPRADGNIRTAEVRCRNGAWQIREVNRNGQFQDASEPMDTTDEHGERLWALAREHEWNA